MSKSYPVIERSDGRLVVLARSAEEAHLAATEELGAGCVVVSVERVRSGGLGGFFSTELVRLIATTRLDAASASGEPSRSATFASAEDLLSALPNSGQFADRLKDELAQLRARGASAADELIVPTLSRTESVTRRDPTRPSPAVAPAPAPSREAVRPFASFDDDPLAGIPVRMAPEDPADDIPVRLPMGERFGGTRAEEVRRPEPVREPEPEPVSYAALLSQLVEAEAAAEVAELAAADPEPLDTGIDDLEWGDAEEQPVLEPAVASAMAARSGFEPLDALDEVGTDALLAQMMATELEYEDRPITRRAEMIRSGSLHHVIDVGPADVPAPVEPVEATAPVEVVEVVEPLLADEPVEAVEVVETVEVVEAVAPIEHIDPVEPPRLPVPVAPAPVWDDWARWSAPMLRAYGVPDTIVQRVAQHDPADDTEWIVAFMVAVRHLCTGLPARHMLVTGPSCANLARQLGLSSQSGDELVGGHGSVASPNASASVLQHQSGDRAVHLVVGGSWHHLVPIRPDIVSAATEHDLLEALRVAEAWGAQLGWTLVGDTYVRIDPYLLAGRVRDLLPEPAAPASAGDLIVPFV